jgi:hypothetical protein
LPKLPPGEKLQRYDGGRKVQHDRPRKKRRKNFLVVCQAREEKSCTNLIKRRTRNSINPLNINFEIVFVVDDVAVDKILFSSVIFLAAPAQL